MWCLSATHRSFHPVVTSESATLTTGPAELKATKHQFDLNLPSPEEVETAEDSNSLLGKRPRQQPIDDEMLDRTRYNQLRTEQVNEETPQAMPFSIGGHQLENYGTSTKNDEIYSGQYDGISPAVNSEYEARFEREMFREFDRAIPSSETVLHKTEGPGEDIKYPLLTRGDIDLGFMEKHLDPLCKALRKHDYHIFSRKTKPLIHVFRGFNAAACFDGRDRTWWIRLVQEKRRFITPSTLIDQLSCLARQMIFSHAAVLCLYQVPPERQNSEHALLLAWLKQEMVTPRDGLPLIGQIPSRPDLSSQAAFGPAQRWIIRGLTEKLDKPGIHPAAVALVGLFCFEHKEEHLLAYDQSFWTQMLDLLTKQKDPKLVVGRSLEENPHRSEWEKLEGFESLMSKERIDKALERTIISKLRFYQMFRRLTEPENLILKKITEEDELDTRREALNVEERPVCLLPVTKPDLVPDSEEKAKTEGGEYAYTIRLKLNMNRRLSKDQVQKRMRKILDNLQAVHETALNWLVGQGTPIIDDAHDLFLGWLHDVLLSPHGSLPVFGTVLEKPDLEVLSPSLFGNVQAAFIGSLARPLFGLRKIQFVQAVLGFWYKKTYPSYWATHFKDEEKYRKMMWQALSATDQVHPLKMAIPGAKIWVE